MKKYTAFLTHTGTSEMIWSKVLVNDFDIELTRTGAGVYTINTDGEFLTDKTIPKERVYLDATGNKYKFTHTSEDVMTITTYAAADLNTPADGVLSEYLVDIEVYD